MSRAIDLTGQRFGHLSVLVREDSDSRGRVRWWCECSCGRRIATRGDSLRNGLATSCGKGECTAWHGVKGPSHPRWRGGNTYGAVHAQMRRDRGAANGRSCFDCEGPARDWSYAGGDPDELVTADGLRFSKDQDRYVPRCRSCHVTHDNNLEVVR